MTVIEIYSRTAPTAVHAMATGSCPMTPPTMLDGLEPVMTSSGFAITRRGRSGDVAVTGAGGEECCGSRAFGDADAAPCAPHCTRIVSHYQDVGTAPPFAHGDAPKPHRYADTVAKPLIGRAPWRRPACHSAGCGVGCCRSPCEQLHWHHHP